MRATQRLAATVLVLLSTSCGALQPPRDYDQLARRVLRLTQANDSAALAPLLDPALTSPTARAQLRQVGDSLRAWAPDSVALIGWNVFSGAVRKSARLTYELRGPQHWGAAVLSFERRTDGLRLNGLHISTRTQSMASENAFTLRRRSGKHYLILAALCCSVLFSFASAIRVIRTPMPRRWWLGALALVSVGTVQLNWTTGASRVLPAIVSLFGGGVTKSGPVAPWIVSVALPLGACIALWRRAEYLKRSRTPPAPPAAPAEPIAPAAV
jgi:hypothetical protein